MFWRGGIIVRFSSISFRLLGGAYFWPYLRGVYFLKRYNGVIILCSLAKNKAHLYKDLHEMIRCRTTGLSEIHVPHSEALPVLSDFTIF